MRYLIGNWKSYNTISQTHIWLSEFSQAHLPKANLTAIICAPFTNLAEVNRLINQLNLPSRSALKTSAPKRKVSIPVKLPPECSPN